MSNEYHPLAVSSLAKGATFVKPRQNVLEMVTLSDPALAVMTDFSLVTAHTILPLEQIEAARSKMIHNGVRSLLVVDDLNAILGLVTATDLTSERPMQVIQTQGIRHADVLVKDIMTPRERLEVLSLDDLQRARVGDLVATLTGQGRQHALVVERLPDRRQILRGMISASQIGRQLGTPIHTHQVARTFAEIRAELNG